ncbi:MAG: hypothetical protein LBV01_03390, partial [Deltaproteobacteria bacterium]|nr:hypothetical protein [Deltaproteobacteria bacterium]
MSTQPSPPQSPGLPLSPPPRMDELRAPGKLPAAAPGGHPPTADKAPAAAPRKEPPPAAPQHGVFGTIGGWFVPQSANPADIAYMNEVDKALNSKGHPFAFLLSLAILVFFVVFVVWASWAKLDEVTRGMGQIIPSQRTQEIQNLEGGILEAMYVREGQDVNDG